MYGLLCLLRLCYRCRCDSFLSMSYCVVVVIFWFVFACLHFLHSRLVLFFFFFNDTAPTEIYTNLHTLSLHDPLPSSRVRSSLLECRRHQSAWSIFCLVFPQYLSREQPENARTHHRRRSWPGSWHSRHADLYIRLSRRPYRALACGLCHNPVAARPHAFRTGRIGAYCRRHQSTGQGAP